MEYVGVIYIIICVLIQYSGISDFHYLINGAIYIMLMTDLLLFAWVGKVIYKRIRDKQMITNCIFQLSGIISLVVFECVEVVRSMYQDRIDRAGLVRVGMLILCLCFAISSQIEKFKNVEKGCSMI